jgi:hypothetical protein
MQEGFTYCAVGLYLPKIAKKQANLYFTTDALLFALGRQARPGRQTGIRLYRPVPAEEQNKSWGHRLTAKAITYQGRHLNNK